MGPELIQKIAIWLPALLLSLTVHEYAHAWMATRLGDSTPSREGRLTLSPMSHIDPIGTLLFPGFLLLITSGATTFGWAKPVRFEPANFRRTVSMRRGAAITAVAGPLSNVGLAFVSALLFALLQRLGVIGGGGMAAEFLSSMFYLNVLLAVFNALPLPPLDGSYLLPRSMDELKGQLARWAPLIFLLLFIGLPGLPAPGHFVLRPMMQMLGGLLSGIVGLLV